jgi:hypothetical protein
MRTTLLRSRRGHVLLASTLFVLAVIFRVIGRRARGSKLDSTAFGIYRWKNMKHFHAHVMVEDVESATATRVPRMHAMKQFMGCCETGAGSVMSGHAAYWKKP